MAVTHHPGRRPGPTGGVDLGTLSMNRPYFQIPVLILFQVRIILFGDLSNSEPRQDRIVFHNLIGQISELSL